MNFKAYKVGAIVTAAGSGRRMGAALPKQFIEIDGKPILQRTLERLAIHSEIALLNVVLPSTEFDRFSKMVASWKVDKVNRILPGGDTRHQSVHNGLEALPAAVDIVLIHDGVRPFVTDRMVSESIAAAAEYGAAVVGIPPKDTIKQVEGNRVTGTLNRHELFAAQTPQTFQRDLIRRANEFAFQHNIFSTDDAALVEQIGGTVALVPGSYQNIKITSPDDLIIARAFLQEDSA